MVSMSPRWVSEKLCAEAATGMAPRASASSAGTSKRNEGIGEILFRDSRLRNRKRPGVSLVALLAGQRLCCDDVVGLDPSGCADGETGLGARGEFARGLVVAAKESGLRRREVSLCVISLSAIGHGELHIPQRRLGLACHRRTQNPDRFVSIGFIIGGHERLPK